MPRSPGGARGRSRGTSGHHSYGERDKPYRDMTDEEVASRLASGDEPFWHSAMTRHPKKTVEAEDA